MSIRDLYELDFLCKSAGFANCGEVNAYMKAHGINCRELFNELDASNVRINGTIATKDDLAALDSRVRSGLERVTAKCRNGIIYYQTL